MSDTWQYRIRVTGPDRAKWLAKATEHKWGGKEDKDRDLIDWPMTWLFDDGETIPAKSTWYNVRVTETPDHAEFLGNFGGAPRYSFDTSTLDARVGPALFDGLDIEVEIVGHSWCCDCPGGIYSYRDVWLRGERVSTEKADNNSVAEKYAPELLIEFPDIFTPEERARFEDDDARPDDEYEREGDSRVDLATVAIALNGLVKRDVL